MSEKGQFCKSHNWKICLAGFLSDFAGAAFLFAVNQLMYAVDAERDTFIGKAADCIMYNPISNILSFVIVAIAIAIAAVCIYFLDKGILIKAGLDLTQAEKSALRLAAITAPYLYLIPSELFYN